ncbi:NAD-dependent epimerase/dehydratase family protein [Butyrivibrio sp. NC3005]|uniref:NAD-dependent epimerase/dehydratase family protein n=1 Tax=Butyrivibrio sp. NC3005 TaxID=1280685 RepID=UPI000406AED7|nr:NAD-dependent epimerase/dehydratase family protein [Butyrivibrio sp. NC3005]
MKKKIMITGGNGFIGTNVCKYCYKDGVDFLSIGKSGQSPIVFGHGIAIDILDKGKLVEVMKEYRPDVVIHLAGIATPVYSDFSQLYQVNVLGTEYLLEAMTEAELPSSTRFIMTSSAGIYGNQKPKFLSEELQPDPVNHYSFSKMIAEKITSHKMNEFEICIVRPFTVVGPGQVNRFFVAKLVEHFANHAKEIQVGNLKAVRDYISVEFCARVIYELAITQEFPKGIMNICSSSEYSCEDVIHVLEDITGEHPEIKSTADNIRANEIWRLVGDSSKLATFINGKFECESFESVLQRMLACVKV